MPRASAWSVDVTDLMRRMVKEDLLKFDGTPLFPERIAYTVPYELSDAEARLYCEVTDYVREESTVEFSSWRSKPPRYVLDRLASTLSIPISEFFVCQGKVRCLPDH
jgi:hypothetical protein